MTEPEKRAFRRRYLKATGLLVSDARIEAALSRAHALRQFEIDNYWKRSTYFWGFQAVAFAALALLFKDGRIGQPGLIAPVAILGFVTALTGWLTAKGSKFWQENWERHVDLLEDRCEGKVAKTVLTAEGISYSVSRLNERLLLLLMTGWCIIFVSGLAVVAYPGLLAMSSERWIKLIQIGAPLLFFFVSMLAVLKGTKSDLPGQEYGMPNFDTAALRSPRKRRKSPTIIKR